MERLVRIIFLGLFIVGFVGALASPDKDESKNGESSSIVSLLRDVSTADEADDINNGRWNQDIANNRSDSAFDVQKLLSKNAVRPAATN